MNEKRHNFLVGLFVLFGLAALVTLILLFGRGPRMLRPQEVYHVVVHFDRAAGIRPGTLVNVGGITVGQVRDVGFADVQRFDKGVLVLVEIQQEYQLPPGSRALTIEPGLGMGRPEIEIVPGEYTGQWLAEGAEIPGEVRGAMESLVPPNLVALLEETAVQISDVAVALKPVLDDMHAIMMPRTPAEVDQPAGPPGNLSSAIARVDSTFKNLNDVLGDTALQADLKESVANIHEVTVNAKTAAEDIRVAAADFRTLTTDTGNLIQRGNQTLENFDTRVTDVGRALVLATDEISRMLADTRNLLARIERGEGTLGKLSRDDRLYESLVLTVRRLDETLEEFRLLAKEWQKGKIRVSF